MLCKTLRWSLAILELYCSPIGRVRVAEDAIIQDSDSGHFILPSLQDMVQLLNSHLLYARRKTRRAGGKEYW